MCDDARITTRGKGTVMSRLWKGAAIVALMLCAVAVGGRIVHAQSLGGVTITINITSDDVASLGDAGQGYIGTWTIAFAPDETYTVSQNGSQQATGTWSLA